MSSRRLTCIEIDGITYQLVANNAKKAEEAENLTSDGLSDLKVLLSSDSDFASNLIDSKWTDEAIEAYAEKIKAALLADDSFINSLIEKTKDPSANSEN